MHTKVDLKHGLSSPNRSAYFCAPSATKATAIVIAIAVAVQKKENARMVVVIVADLAKAATRLIGPPFKRLNSQFKNITHLS